MRLLATARCLSDINCPAVLELPNGDLAVIGKLVDDTDPERATVAVPAKVFDDARAALNRLVEHDRHAREMDDLRDQQHELRTRQRTD